VLSWDSCPPELSPPRFRVRFLAPTHAGARKLLATHVAGRPAIAVAFRDPDSDAWVREPRIRRCAVVYRTPRTTVRRRPSSRNASRAPVRQSPAPFAALRPLRTERLARAPVRRHPAPPNPSRPSPPKGPRPLGLEDALFLEPLTVPRPLRAETAATPLAEHGLVARCQVDREVD